MNGKDVRIVVGTLVKAQNAWEPSEPVQIGIIISPIIPKIVDFGYRILTTGGIVVERQPHEIEELQH